MKELLLRVTCESCGRIEERTIEPSEVNVFAVIFSNGFERSTKFGMGWHETPNGEVLCERCKLVRERIDLIDRKEEI